VLIHYLSTEYQLLLVEFSYFCIAINQLLFKVKHAFILLLIIIGANFSQAQLDDLHYIPPMHSFDPVIDIGDHVLYLSTPEVTPVNYTIEDGAGNILQTGTVSNAAPVTYSLAGTNTDFDVLANDLHTVLPDRGFIISASDSIYANLRMRGGSSQAASITAKGRVAAGTDFRIFTVPLQSANNYRNHVVGIMATENNTVVNIDLTGSGVTLVGAGAPPTGTVITLNMNAGDSYVLAASSLDDVDNLTGMIGHRITSNNPIVVNSGSWTGTVVGAGGQDIVIDQMAPSSALGQEFVTVKGLGANNQEVTMVIANQNNTSIYINGSATPITTINAGDFFLIDGTNYINGALYVETSAPAYVWQVLCGSNSTATQGGIFVPSLSCFSPTGVDLIPDIEMIGGTTFSGGVSIVTLAGATVTLNGAPIGVGPTNVAGSIYEYYQVFGLTGDVSVQSTESCAVAFFGASGAIGYGGYFSGFSEVVLNLGADGLLNPSGSSFCIDSTALVDVNSDYQIQWLLDDLPILGATDDTLIPVTAGYYSVEISSPGGLCTDTTNQVLVIDDLDPMASDPLPVDVQCIGDVPAPDINVVTDEADFCTTFPTVAFVSDVSNGQTCPEIITRTYSVTDNSGNSINVTQTITVNDDIPPTASNPPTLNVQCIGDVPAPDINVVADEADNCTVNPVVALVSDVSDGLTCPETIVRTYSVTDDCGNSINVTHTIIVNDDIAPTASNPLPINVQCLADVPPVDVSVVTDEADNCTANPTVAFVSEVSNGQTCPEIITRTYSVTDDCGNSINVTQTITVNDDTDPTASNPPSLNVACLSDVPPVDVSVVTDEADNCTANPVVSFLDEQTTGQNCDNQQIVRRYTVTDDCGNSIVVIHNIYIDASFASIGAGLDLEVCEGTSVTLTAANPNTANISWTAPVQDNVPFVAPVGLNTYTVTADVCQGQCITTDDVEVLVHPNPVVSFGVDDPLGCIEHSVIFTNSSTETDGVCNWNLGNGTEVVTTGNDPVPHTYTTPGLYDVSLEVVSQYGCASSLVYTDYIDVTPLPIADFTFSPENLSITENTIDFTNESLNAQTYQWYFVPLNSQSTETSPIVDFPYEPNEAHEVTLYAYSYGGCYDSISKPIRTIDDPLFFVPNTFTPDGDEYNNTFRPIIATGIDLADYHLTIFNRWGEVLFESFNYEIGWDGTYNGSLVQDGMYMWKLEFGARSNDSRVIEVGHINMLR